MEGNESYCEQLNAKLVLLSFCKICMPRNFLPMYRPWEIFSGRKFWRISNSQCIYHIRFPYICEYRQGKFW